MAEASGCLNKRKGFYEKRFNVGGSLDWLDPKEHDR
jgi:hypothetical protein